MRCVANLTSNLTSTNVAKAVHITQLKKMV